MTEHDFGSVIWQQRAYEDPVGTLLVISGLQGIEPIGLKEFCEYVRDQLTSFEGHVKAEQDNKPFPKFPRRQGLKDWSRAWDEYMADAYRRAGLPPGVGANTRPTNREYARAESPWLWSTRRPYLTEYRRNGMRELSEHKVTPISKLLDVHALDEPGARGAHYAYQVSWWEGDNRAHVHLGFHDPFADNPGPNGITNESLLAIVADRLMSIQEGELSSKENAKALTHLSYALHFLDRSGCK